MSALGCGLPCVGLVSVRLWVCEGVEDGLPVVVHALEPVPGCPGVVPAVEPPGLLHLQVPLKMEEQVVARHRSALHETRKSTIGRNEIR